MLPREYAPVERLDIPPLYPFVEAPQRRKALLNALRGVEMGSYDRRAVSELVELLDDTRMKVIVSWLERVRDTAIVGMVTLAEHMENKMHPPEELRANGNSAAEADTYGDYRSSDHPDPNRPRWTDQASYRADDGEQH